MKLKTGYFFKIYWHTKFQDPIGASIASVSEVCTTAMLMLIAGSEDIQW
jgi:hypothetical protein